MIRLALASLLLAGPLAAKVAAQDLIFRDGFELVCPPEMGDCNGDGVDCETSLRTLSNCGSCGVPCAIPHGSCASGTCEPCPAGSGECDGNGATSCETSLETVSDCGDCDHVCSNDHGSTSCSGATCVPVCDALWKSCDGDPDNGCERSIDTLSDCGDCNAACNLPNASEFCNAGQCQLLTCDTGFGNCDGSVGTGCEQPLSTLAHCGGCNQPCELANASESCATQTCQLTSCDAGFSNCDGSTATGCETQHSGHSNTSPGEDLGFHNADSKSGFVCPDVGCTFRTSRAGRRGRFFTVRAREDSSCEAYVALRFVLTSPAGTNYNLYVTGGQFCNPAGCSSTSSGSTDTVTVWSNDSSGDDSFTAVVEVRHASGSSCQNWSLVVSAGGC